MTYYQAKCMTHDELYKPLVATEPGEILNPAHDTTCSCCGKPKYSSGAERLMDWLSAHSTCNLVEVENCAKDEDVLPIPGLFR